MVALKLGLTKTNKNKENNKSSYEQWREFRKDIKENYIMVPTELKDYLPHIHTQAINLYLYYFFRARNNTGLSWPSVDRVAKDLDVSSRSINYWNDELEGLGLIARVNENRSSKLTYLLPISNFYYLEKEETLESYLEKSNEKIDGKLFCMFHFFQWRLNKETEEYSEKLNIMYLVFKRTGVSKDGSKVKDVFKIVGIEPKNEETKKIGIEKKPDDFKKDIYRISGISLEIENTVPLVSLAISTKLNLLGTKEKETKEMLQLFEQIIENLDDLHQIEEVSIQQD